MSIQHLGMLDLNYAVSPNGKKLAVLNLNTLFIYDLPDVTQ